jgi:uncharacterized RDD family membrane protein YckC
MSEQPPGLPPGSYPPPPSRSGNFPPPPPQGGAYPPQGGGYPPQGGGYPPPWGAGAIGTLPRQAYTPWIMRVGALLIDGLITSVIVIIGAVALVVGPRSSDCDSSGSCAPGAVTLIVFWLAVLAALAFSIWNYGYRQGTTGSSVGKSVAKFKVVSEMTGQPIGFGPSIARQLAHLLDNLFCHLGYLFPLWDAKRQTFADKIMKTVCVPITS